MLALILQRFNFFCLPSPGIEENWPVKWRQFWYQVCRWGNDVMGSLLSWERSPHWGMDGGALQGIPTVTLPPTWNTKAGRLVLAKWGIGKPNYTRSSDTSTFGTRLKNQNRTKSSMGYFKLTLLYVNLTLGLKSTGLKTRKTHFIPKCLPASKKPPLYRQL